MPRESRAPVMFVAAHPDDEVLGASSKLGQNPTALVVHVTDGAPRDMGDAHACGFATRHEYADARRREAREALARAGVDPARILSLEIVDQEAALALEPLARRLAWLFDVCGTGLIYTHPYEGGHPDHDAAAFAVHAARALLQEKHGPSAQVPEIW